MEAVEVKFRIWADDEAEAAALSEALQGFVNDNGANGIAITAKRAAEAVNKWKDNYLIKSKIINYFSL